MPTRCENVHSDGRDSKHTAEMLEVFLLHRERRRVLCTMAVSGAPHPSHGAHGDGGRDTWAQRSPPPAHTVPHISGTAVVCRGLPCAASYGEMSEGGRGEGATNRDYQ